MNDLKRLSKTELRQCLDELVDAPSLDDKTRNLLHDLEVYQVELELQNRELRETQEALESSRDRYADLYLQAPVGYLTLDGRGIIHDINFAAAELLGSNRDFLQRRPLFQWLAPSDALRVLAHLRQVFAYPNPATLEVRLVRADGEKRDARLQSFIVCESGQLQPLCRSVLIDMTEHRRSETALRESERRFRQMAETIREVFWLASPTLSTLYYLSPAFEEIWGRPVAEAYAHPRLWRDVVHPEDAPQVQAALARLEHEGRFNLEYRVVRPDGTTRWINDRGYSLYDPAGQLTLHSGVASDISERKQVEQALRDSEIRANLILETAPEAMLVVDTQGYLIRANSRAHTLFNYAPGGLLGRNVDELVPERLRGRHAQLRHGYARNPEPRARGLGRELIAQRQDGSEFAAELSLAPVCFDAVPHTIVSINDITARKQAEAALTTAQQALEIHKEHLEELVRQRTAQLADEQAHTRLILDSSADGLFGVDTEGRISFVNPAACEMLGYAAEDLIGRPSHATLHHSYPDGRVYPWEQCPLFSVLSEGQRVRRDKDVFWCRDGRPMPVTYGVQPMYRDGQLVGAVTSFMDISARQLAEAAREQAHREAERLAQVRSDFLANMSHEIRTPLNAVLGLAQVGLRENQGRRAHDTFAHILEAGQLLLGIINDILDFSKIEAGKLHPEWRVFGLGTAVDRALEVTAALAYAKNLDFWVEEAADLPTYWVGDSLRLAQILVNLLSNAIKFTEQGQVVLRVEQIGAELVCTVTDTGIGITPEQRQRLFTPFEQADGSVMRRFGGTGLGLAISKRLTDLMGGTLQVESRYGDGTCFELRLIGGAEEPPILLNPLPNAPLLLADLPSQEAARLTSALVARGLSVCRCADPASLPAAPLLVLPAGNLGRPVWQAAVEQALAQGQVVAVVTTPGQDSELLPGLQECVRTLARPLRARQLLALLQAKPAPIARTSGRRLAGLNLLAAEDNEVNRLVLEEILADEGCRLTCAADGRQAVEWIQAATERYDLVLMDVQMPEMDGYTATRLLHAHDPQLPVIGLTAHAMAEERTRCLAAGMVEHVTKPIQLDVLVAAILRHVSPPAIDSAALISTLRSDLARAPLISLDWDALEARFRGKKAFVLRLARMVLENDADTAERLRTAAAFADLATIAFIAHSLKGMAGNLLAVPLQELAREVEALAKQGHQEALAQVEPLAQSLEALLSLLAARVATETLAT